MPSILEGCFQSIVGMGATEPSADPMQLTELANDIHLWVSANLIGAISANLIMLEASVNAKMTQTANTLRRVKAKLMSIMVFFKWFKDAENIDLEDLKQQSNHRQKKNSAGRNIVKIDLLIVKALNAKQNCDKRKRIIPSRCLEGLLNMDFGRNTFYVTPGLRVLPC